MFLSYLKIAFRKFWRFKTFSFINLMSLVMGMSVCLFVFAFVRYETNFDKQYPKNIYRLCEIQQQQQDVKPAKIAQMRFPVATALKNEIPAITDFTRIVSWEKVPMTVANNINITATTFGTDASFFRLFGIPLLSGDTATALRDPGGLVLTQTLARRLFGDSDPMGKLVQFERRDTLLFHVTGVMRDMPEQSHLQFEALYSLSTEERPDWNKNWTTSWTFTYLKLQDNADVELLESQFPAFITKHMDAQAAKRFKLFLQPLRDIHLHSADITHDLINAKKFNGRYIPLLIAVAMFVLVLGMINYINLSTARLLTRAKEVGIRKTNGAQGREIVLQILSETVMFSLCAFGIAILLYILLRPYFANILQTYIPMLTLHDPLLYVIAGCMIFITGIAAGAVPAYAMARIKPVAVLKGKLWMSYRSPLRSGLVIVQFAIAIGLSMAAYTVRRQLNFIRQYDHGFNKEAVIVIPVGYTDMQTEEGLIKELQHVPGVSDVTGALRRLGGGMDLNAVVFTGDQGEQTFRSATMFVDLNYISFYKINILAGRNFSADYAADKTGQSYVINETMARQLMPGVARANNGYASLIGRPFKYGFEDSLGNIIAVVRDFNFNSLYQQVEPVCITYQSEYFFPDLSIRLNTEDPNIVISRIEKVWKTVYPGQVFTWNYLDTSLQNLYASDRQTGVFMNVFTIIAFFISCLGLIGVATFTIERRIKEIGIRKVLGATVQDIVLLLSTGIVKLVLISICIAFPVAWWWMHHWLDEFAYRTTIAWWMFAGIALAAALIALLTVGVQSLKTALDNPVDSIRNE